MKMPENVVATLRRIVRVAVLAVVALATVGLTGCKSEFERLQEQARWGDAEAYVKLAECYRTGNGTERNLLKAMAMLLMAEEYGGQRVEAYMAALPEDEPLSLLPAIEEKLKQEDYDGANALAARMTALGLPGSEELIGAVVALESGRKNEVEQLVKQAIDKGNPLAKLLPMKLSEDEATMLSVAEDFPVVYNMLARNVFTKDVDPKEDEKAAMYYKKADEQLCLDRRAAGWLASYYEYLVKNGEQRNPPTDMERWRVLSEGGHLAR